MQQEIIKLIQSCIVARKGGMPLLELKDEYRELVGEEIPYERLGYHSLGTLISSLPEIIVSRNEDGITILTSHSTKASHISELVSKQKYAPTKRKMKRVNENIPPKRNYNYQGRYQETNFKNNKRQMFRENKIRQFANKHIDTDRKYNNSNNSFFNYKSPFTVTSSRNKNRQAAMVGNILTVTVNNKYSGSSDVDFKDCSYEDYLIPGFGIAINDINNMNDVLQSDVEPTIFRHQMLGDDFFLHLAVKSIGALPSYKDNILCNSGLCISGQTIRECRKRIITNQVLGHNVIVLLGAIDLLEGANLSDMKDDMLELIFSLTTLVDSAVILTIPPLVNIKHMHKKWHTLMSFNNWLRELQTGERCHILDVWPLFKGGGVQVYDYYEGTPRKGESSSYIVLWNKRGRINFIEFLKKNLNSFTNF